MPQGKKEIYVKWVYKVKLNTRGDVTIHKARLVAKGFDQREGIDFNEAFAPVVRIEITRLVIGLVNINNWSMCQMDLQYAFLNGPLDEEVYVTQLDGW